MADSSKRFVPAPMVAVASWVLPGAGHWLLGQRSRALAIGVTVTVLFIAGILIGGVRLIEVPGYGDHGLPLVVSQHRYTGEVTESTSESVPADARPVGWVMKVHPLDEIRNKPWFVAQVLTGPIDLLASWGSVKASRLGPSGEPAGWRSHSRTNELGLLYTTVAGMLNLLAIIDATSRASAAGEDR